MSDEPKVIELNHGETLTINTEAGPITIISCEDRSVLVTITPAMQERRVF